MRIIFPILTIFSSIVFAVFWSALMAYGMGMSGGSSSVSSYSNFILIAPFIYLLIISVVSFFPFRLWSYLSACGAIVVLVGFSLLLEHDGAKNEKGIVTGITCAIPAMWAIFYPFFLIEERESEA